MPNRSRRIGTKESYFSSTSDSKSWPPHSSESQSELNGQNQEALSLVKGGFAYSLLFEDKLVAALDPNGLRPLSIGKMANGAVVVSSETCALKSSVPSGFVM